MSIATIKSLGQHFLTDPGIIDHLIQIMAPQKNQHWLEIGAGLGALTLPLLPLVKHLDVVEIDPRLIKELKTDVVGSAKQKTLRLIRPTAEIVGSATVTFHEQDILRFRLETIAKQAGSLYVCGNLPYQISTPLLFHLFAQLECIHSMFFMLQKEVALRLAAEPSHKEYGRLSVHAQSHCQVIPLLEVQKEAFTPAPKVGSLFVKLVPHRPPLYPDLDSKLFHEVVQEAFMSRRKTLRNALRKWLSSIDFEQLEISPTKRPDQVSVEEYVKICRYLE